MGGCVGVYERVCILRDAESKQVARNIDEAQIRAGSGREGREVSLCIAVWVGVVRACVCSCVVPAESTAMVGRVDRRVVHLTGPWNALAEATSRNTTFMMQDGTFNVEVELGNPDLPICASCQSSTELTTKVLFCFFRSFGSRFSRLPSAVWNLIFALFDFLAGGMLLL